MVALLGVLLPSASRRLRMRVHRGGVALGAFFGLLLVASRSTASGHDPFPYPTPAWVAAQLIPSPEWASSPTGLHFGLRWQLTPFAYSFGMNRHHQPFRAFVVEPLTRQNGSVEVFVTPEILSLASEAASRWLLRVGLRSYFPLLEHGERLSVSVGSSTFVYHGEPGAAFELGAYTLFGILGAQFTYSPTFAEGRYIATLRLRYF